MTFDFVIGVEQDFYMIFIRIIENFSYIEKKHQ